MTLLFFNIGAGELFVIVLVTLLFFGSKRIPDLARTLGKGLRQVRDASQAIQQDIADSASDIKKEIEKKDT